MAEDGASGDGERRSPRVIMTRAHGMRTDDERGPFVSDKHAGTRVIHCGKSVPAATHLILAALGRRCLPRARIRNTETTIEREEPQQRRNGIRRRPFRT